MNQRVKTNLRAPEGVEESIIEGTYYWPDPETGEVTTTNENHVKVLRQHGFTVTGTVSIMKPAAALGAIDHDELGRQGLAAALRERGLSFPESATRSEMAEIAEGWNRARRRGNGSVSSAALQMAQEAPRTPAATFAAPTPPAPTGATPPAGGDGDAAGAAVTGAVDFGEATYEELKGWLTARAIAYPGNSSKKALREMAEAAHAQLLAQKAAA